MTNNFNKQGFNNAINEMKQLPRSQWLEFAKSMYEKAQDGTYNDRLNQAQQMMNSNNPMILKFINSMGQYGITF